MEGEREAKVAGTWGTGGGLGEGVGSWDQHLPTAHGHQPRTRRLAGSPGQGILAGLTAPAAAAPRRRWPGEEGGHRAGCWSGLPRRLPAADGGRSCHLWRPCPRPRPGPRPCPTCSASAPASSRLCRMANCSRSSSSSRRGSLRSVPSTLYPSGTSNTAGSTSQGKGLPARQKGSTQPQGSETSEQQPLHPPPPAVPEAVTAEPEPEPGAGTHTELRGSSQPHRLLKVMRALSTWKRGISVRRQRSLSQRPAPPPGAAPDPWLPQTTPHQS